ncbi:MAG: hypothetical protein WBP64_18865 [Nitrososphaeraceae archaeon]
MGGNSGESRKATKCVLVERLFFLYKTKKAMKPKAPTIAITEPNGN